MWSPARGTLTAVIDAFPLATAQRFQGDRVGAVHAALGKISIREMSASLWGFDLLELGAPPSQSVPAMGLALASASVLSFWRPGAPGCHRATVAGRTSLVSEERVKVC